MFLKKQIKAKNHPQLASTNLKNHFELQRETKGEMSYFQAQVSLRIEEKRFQQERDLIMKMKNNSKETLNKLFEKINTKKIDAFKSDLTQN